MRARWITNLALIIAGFSVIPCFGGRWPMFHDMHLSSSYTQLRRGLMRASKFQLLYGVYAALDNSIAF